jgi:Fe/S biogenesis protein NfuA
MAFVPESEAGPLLRFDVQGLSLGIRPEQVSFLEGTEILVDDSGALEIRNPSLSLRKLDGSIEEQVQILLDEQINPMVASHGGVVRLHGMKDDAVYLEFGGGCQGCGMIDVTLKQGVEVMIKENIPQISGVFDVTDHQSGDNPFYR